MHLLNAGAMLVHRLQCRPNHKPASGKRLLTLCPLSAGLTVNIIKTQLDQCNLLSICTRTLCLYPIKHEQRRVIDTNTGLMLARRRWRWHYIISTLVAI